MEVAGFVSKRNYMKASKRIYQQIIADKFRGHTLVAQVAQIRFLSLAKAMGIFIQMEFSPSWHKWKVPGMEPAKLICMI